MKEAPRSQMIDREIVAQNHRPAVAPHNFRNAACDLRRLLRSRLAVEERKIGIRSEIPKIAGKMGGIQGSNVIDAFAARSASPIPHRGQISAPVAQRDEVVAPRTTERIRPCGNFAGRPNIRNRRRHECPANIRIQIIKPAEDEVVCASCKTPRRPSAFNGCLYIYCWGGRREMSQTNQSAKFRIAADIGRRPTADNFAVPEIITPDQTAHMLGGRGIVRPLCLRSCCR